LERPAFLERQLGHQFTDVRLLNQALTHSTHSADHYERLEFLGDGVLGCVISEALYGRFPRAREGELSRLRDSLIRIEALASVATSLGLAGQLKLGSGLQGAPTMAMLGDALEAVFGAVLVDAGYEAAKSVILRVYSPLIDKLDLEPVEKDAKSRLQEFLQASKHHVPKYRVVSSRQRNASQTFEVECAVPELGFTTTGTGTSRQRAEQEAARAMLEKLAG
jgi:ribonuclease III